MTLLHIDSSARQSSTSRRLTTHFVEAWRSVSDELIDELFAADVIVIGASIVRRAGQVPHADVERLRNYFNLVVGTDIDVPVVRTSRSTQPAQAVQLLGGMSERTS
jgi:FMN-dependent NADH-azoreductase